LNSDLRDRGSEEMRLIKEDLNKYKAIFDFCPISGYTQRAERILVKISEPFKAFAGYCMKF